MGRHAEPHLQGAQGRVNGLQGRRRVLASRPPGPPGEAPGGSTWLALTPSGRSGLGRRQLLNGGIDSTNDTVGVAMFQQGCRRVRPVLPRPSPSRASQELFFFVGGVFVIFFFVIFFRPSLPILVLLIFLGLLPQPPLSVRPTAVSRAMTPNNGEGASSSTDGTRCGT